MTTLGSYELGEVLGRGAMGEVHRGIRIGSGDQMAVKVLRSEFMDDPEILARFLQERSVLCSLDHPNLVRVHDLVVEGGSAAIVMDLVDGTDLRHLLKANGTLPPADASRLILQLLNALTVVHDMGIVHRDVKPENVLVGSDGVVRLTDFGIARLTRGPSLTRMTGLIGTPEYLAPELAQYEIASSAADVYASGIMFYELLTGFTPFAGGHPVAVLRRHVEDPPSRPEGLPDPLWALLASMLAKDPTARPTAEEAHRRLAGISPELEGLSALVPSRPKGVDDDSATVQRLRRDTDEHENKDEDEDQDTVLRSSKRAGAVTETHRPRRTPALVAAAVVVVAATVGIVVATGGPASAHAKAVFAFAPQTYPSGLTVDRTWTLSGPTGNHLRGVATLTDESLPAIWSNYAEVLPTSVASNVRDIAFTPAYDKVLVADPVVRYDILLDRGVSKTVSFTTDIGPTSGSWTARLARLATAQEAAELAYRRSTGGPTPVTLVSLHALPPTMTITAGLGAQTVSLSGTMSDGSAASAAVLAGVVWTSSAPNIAAVANGAVFGLSPGNSTVTAEAGSDVATVAVTVVASSSQSSGGHQNNSGPTSASPSIGGAGGTATTTPPTQSAGGGSTPTTVFESPTPTTGSPVTPTSTTTTTTSTTLPPTPTTASDLPTPPVGATFQQAPSNPNPNDCAFEWQPPVSDGGSPILSYTSEQYEINNGVRFPAGVGNFMIGAPLSQQAGFNFAGVPVGATWYMRVAAVNANGTGGYSWWLSCGY